jgi:hypothetical protein
VYVAFLAVSGFLLLRYFVPVHPLFAVLGAAAVYGLMPRPVATAYVAAAALLMHLAWYGRFDGPAPPLLDARAEYLRYVAAHARASRFIEERYPGARVAAPWPARDELTQPFLGYVERPVATVDLDSLLDGRAGAEAFDLLYESPVPQNPNPAAEVARRLGLVEVARFEEGKQRVVLWAKP